MVLEGSGCDGHPALCGGGLVWCWRGQAVMDIPPFVEGVWCGANRGIAQQQRSGPTTPSDSAHWLTSQPSHVRA